MRFEKGLRRWETPIAQLVQRQRKPSRLNEGEPQRQPLAVRRRVELPTATIQGPSPDLDEVLVDEFSQHAVEALLGDPQDLQELGDREPRPSG